MHIAFIGHVDAGKSTLCGQILVHTGTVDKQLINKYKKESGNFLSWITDTLDEEREKGKTQDINIMEFKTPKRSYTIIDTPGHRGFVPQMINGISRADVAILIISARTGEFESGFNGGQTTEHLLIARSFGIKYVLIAVNKMSTVDWSKERYNEIVKTFTPYIRDKIGFKENEFCYIPIDALTGDGVDNLLSKLDSIPDFKHEGSFRFVISDKMRNLESGETYVYGNLTGHVKDGDTVIALPSRQSGIVKKVVDDMTLILDIDDVNAGNILCSPDHPIPTTRKVLAKIRNISPHIITTGFTGIIHIHAEHVDVSIEKIKGTHILHPNETAVVQMTFTREICVETKMRFLIRDNEGTVIIGMVTNLPKDAT